MAHCYQQWKRGHQTIDLDDSDSDFLHSGERLGGITDNSSVIESNIKSGNKLLIVDETKEDNTGGWATQKDLTKDIHLCRKMDNGIHPTKRKMVKGWYCKFCL